MDNIITQHLKGNAKGKEKVDDRKEEFTLRWSFGLGGITDIKKHKIEHTLLSYYRHEMSSTDDEKNSLKNMERDCFCLLQEREEISFLGLVRKIVVLLNDHVQQRELMIAEKSYFFLRRRHLLPGRLVDHRFQSYSDEELLIKILNLKKELILCEYEYIDTLGAGDMLPLQQRAVNSRREFLVLEEEYSNFLKESDSMSSSSFFSLSGDDRNSLGNLQMNIRRMLEWKSYISCWEEKLYPTDLAYKFEFTINLLIRLVPMRDEFLIMEEEYLCRLQERYGKIGNNTSSSYSTHFHQVLEHALDRMICWRHDLRMVEDAVFLQTGEERLENKFSSTIDLQEFEKLESGLKKVEKEYVQVVRETYLTTHINISSSMDVDQIYAKPLEGDIVYEIFALGEHLFLLENERNRFLRRSNFNHDTSGLQRIAHAREKFHSLGHEYFDLLYEVRQSTSQNKEGTENGSKINIWSEDEASIFPPFAQISRSSFNIDAEQESNDMMLLYNSIKTCNFYCPNCSTCINKAIRDSINLHDDGEDAFVPSEISFGNGEEVEEIYKVLHKFLHQRSLFCPNCTDYVWSMTMRRRSRSESSETHSQSCDIIAPEIIIIPSDERTPLLERRNRPKRWGLRRIIVLGGLNESIISLVIVTSAASVNFSDEQIVILGLTTLVGGFTIVGYSLSKLEKKKGYTRIEVEEGSRYIKVLNYLRDFSLALLSFIIFGSVPPLVYALSFRESGNRDLKMLAAVGASLSCTALLAIEKARLRKPDNWLVYIKSAAGYVSFGVGACIISYLTTNIFGKLVNQAHWFE